MKEVNLTNRETKTLEDELLKYKSHRKKKLKSFLTTTFIGVLIGGLIAYKNNGGIIFKYFIGLLIVITLYLIPSIIAFLLAKRGITNLSTDIKKGKKIEGKANIKSINFFNRAILLSNGIKVVEPIEYYKTFNVGDLITFKVSPSNEYIFKCSKE